MGLRDVFDRLKYGGVREAGVMVSDARDRAMTGGARFVVGGVAVAAIAAVLAIALWPKPPISASNEQAVKHAETDRELLMAMSPGQLAEEEKRRAAVAAAAGDDDADFATEALERARQVRDTRTRSLSPVGAP